MFRSGKAKVFSWFPKSSRIVHHSNYCSHSRQVLDKNNTGMLLELFVRPIPLLGHSFFIIGLRLRKTCNTWISNFEKHYGKESHESKVCQSTRKAWFWRRHVDARLSILKEQQNAEQLRVNLELLLSQKLHDPIWFDSKTKWSRVEEDLGKEIETLLEKAVLQFWPKKFGHRSSLCAIRRSWTGFRSCNFDRALFKNTLSAAVLSWSWAWEAGSISTWSESIRNWLFQHQKPLWRNALKLSLLSEPWQCFWRFSNSIRKRISNCWASIWVVRDFILNIMVQNRWI